MDGRVLVVGAVNVDLVATVVRRPEGGETVLATGYRSASGGKGANQAVAAARAGADVGLVAAVGDDEAGRRQVLELERRGVRTGSIITVPGLPTGTAMITVTPDAENSIVVAPGANEHLDAGHVDLALRRTGAPAVLVLQTELGAELIDSAIDQAAAPRLVLNNGPWMGLRASTLHRADPLVVNQHEALEACGRGGAAVPLPELARAVREVTRARSVVVTLGALGVSVSGPDGEARIPARPASVVVDTTGAGDAFVGTLAARLALGEPLAVAVGAAVSAASDAVTWSGARPPLAGLHAGAGG